MHWSYQNVFNKPFIQIWNLICQATIIPNNTDRRLSSLLIFIFIRYKLHQNKCNMFVPMVSAVTVSVNKICAAIINRKILSGVRFTNTVLLTIQIWWEFQHALVSWSITLFPPNFAQVSTAVLLRPAQKMVDNNEIFLKPQHVEILITFELWVKLR